MKKINYFLLLCFILIAGSKLNLQAQDESFYKLEIENVAPKNIKFINNSKMKLKVIIYKGRDNTMAIGLKTLTISPGKSASYKVGIYNLKIFKSAVFDKLLSTKKNVSGDVKMSGTEKKFSAVRISTRKNTVFKNNTGKKIKICLYKRKDNLKTIPFETYTLIDNTSTATYNGDEPSFFVSVFKPEIIDRLLVSQICPYQSIITVNKVD